MEFQVLKGFKSQGLEIPMEVTHYSARSYTSYATGGASRMFASLDFLAR